MTLWPSGLRRNVKAFVLFGVGPNFTDVTFTFGYPINLLIKSKYQDSPVQPLFTPNIYRLVSPKYGGGVPPKIKRFVNLPWLNPPRFR